MPTPDAHDSHKKPTDSPGYETTDANIFSVAVFLISLGVLSAVLFVVSFGIGKVINNSIVKEDGPLNKWNAVPGKPSAGLQNMASDPQMEQEELRQMTERFPTPRVLTDNGDQEVVNLNAREDLLLDHYSWIDQKQGKLRIPISRAMELIAQRGLPVAPAVETEPLMTADKAPQVPAPLTDGFARTGYEQQALETMEQQRERGDRPGDVAALGAGR